MDKNWTMSAYYKKIVKTFHIILAASIFGSLLSILIIFMVKQNCHMITENIFAVDLSILRIFTWGVNYAFFALMLTSFIFGLFTEWGFVKYRWIIFKWMIVLSMFAVTCFGLGPAINGMTSIADAGLNSSTMSREYLNFQQRAVVFNAVEIVAILLIFVISVFKPWGIRNVKRQIKQKTVIMILLPLIAIGVGFATINAIKLNTIRNISIKNIDLTRINDGIYIGESKAGNYAYKVKVKVENHKIINIEGIDNRKSPYVTYAEGVFTKIIKQQKVDVDAVTGATTTSKAFMKAVENALNK
ncbi:FMN-binding protein [Clostridium sp. WILCCON 0269]|uniref:FMN-binding protein n=1 Tax=Candidatus Clostridium eludens TaxID=3381663 RepID=A0ABW8SLZ5_9CLOT